jgi:hypothetical protein
VNLPVEVIDAVKAGRCVVFVGNRTTLEAGELAGVALPEQKALAKELGWKKPAVVGAKARVVVPSVEEGAAAYEASRGRSALLATLSEKLSAANVPPSAAHRALVRRFPLLFTTTWDDLLERAAVAEGVQLDVIGRQSPLPADATRHSLVRLRGEFARPDTMVVTAADRARRAIPDATKRQLRTLIRQQVVWFVGFRPDEEEFETLFAELSDAYSGELPRCHLAVAQGAIDDVQWQKWVWRGLLLFTADPTECMSELEARVA